MAHDFKDKNIGVGITGSYCTYKKIFKELKRLADTKANLFTIFSDNAATTDSRFGKCNDFLQLAKEISGKEPITTIPVSYTHLDVYKRQMYMNVHLPLHFQVPLHHLRIH